MRKKIKKKYRFQGKLEPAYIFNSDYEEKKIHEYLYHLIHSKLAKSRPEKLLQFASQILGEKVLHYHLKDKLPKVMEEQEDFEELDDFDDFTSVNFVDYLEDTLSHKGIGNILRKDLSPILHKRIKKLENNRSEIAKRLKNLQKSFNLTEIEIEIVTLAYLKEICEPLDDLINGFDSIYDFSKYYNLRSHGHILFGCKKSAFTEGFSKDTLYLSHVMESNDRHQDAIELTDWCMNYLSGSGESDLTNEFFTKKNEEYLEIMDFDLSEDQFIVLDTLFRSKDRQNILFYGEQGTGKTSLARSIAKHYGKELLTVKIPENDEQSDWLRAIYATVNLADNQHSLVLIDEADEILNLDQFYFFDFGFSGNRTSKSWINQFLDNHNKKIIWITNHTSTIDPSTMRRFSFSVEFKDFNVDRRLKVLKYELKKRKLENYFDQQELLDLCQHYSVNASGIVNAINVLNITRRSKKENSLRKIKTVLRSHEKAISQKPKRKLKVHDFKSYSIKALHTSENIEHILQVIEKYMKHQDEYTFKKHYTMALLLHGLPGTGKSEFVYYLGHKLKKEIHLKRSSEIKSMWVGETEKNIARAFRDAQEEQKILFFDEADSFLHPRSSSRESWEKDFTNEILTQMEHFSGLVIFATNHLEGLDHAALRRFKFKIEFKPLNPDGNLICYNTLLKPLVSAKKSLSKQQEKMIKSIKYLTPGDFAVVKDQFSFVDETTIDHDKLISSLQNEVKYKMTSNRVVGFDL